VALGTTEEKREFSFKTSVAFVRKRNTSESKKKKRRRRENLDFFFIALCYFDSLNIIYFFDKHQNA
jgi:hypothetical protein